MIDLALYNPWLSGATYVNSADETVPYTVDETGATDCSETLIAAVDNAPRANYSCPALYLPPGAALRLSSAFRIYYRVELIGNGCCLVPDSGVNGIEVFNDGLTNPSAPLPAVSANDSIIRSVIIRSANPAATAEPGTGVLVQSSGVVLYDILVNGKAVGIEVDGTGDVFNANYGRMYNVRVSRATTHGVYFHGSDANQWLVAGLRLLGGVGLLDSAFLHNTYITPSSEQCVTRSLEWDGDSNACTVVGAYIESGDPSPVIDASGAVTLGGNINRFWANTSKHDFIGYGGARIRFNFPADKNGGAAYTSVSIPGGATKALGWQRRVTETHGWFLEYVSAGMGKPHRWALRSEHTGEANTPLSWVADTEGTPNPTGQIYPGIAAADEGSISTSVTTQAALEAFFASMLLPPDTGLQPPGAAMGPENDSTACAIDMQEYTDFSETISLALIINEQPRYARAIKALDVTSGSVLQVTTLVGTVRNLTVSEGELIEGQCLAINTGTTCDKVRVYW